MSKAQTMNMVRLTAAMACAIAGVMATAARGQSIVNGGFETGFLGWTTANMSGSDGAFVSQSGTASPLNGSLVPAAPQGTHAAMTDSAAGGSHVLYQDFIVPAVVGATSLRFSLFLNNANDSYFNPASLDWAMTNQIGGLTLNQQARVDIITTGADVFSVGPADVLANLFATTTTTPLVTGYNAFDIDVTALLQVHAGQTLRLRFAEVDNVNFFNLGVDDVSFRTIPAPASGIVASLAAVGLLRRRRTRR